MKRRLSTTDDEILRPQGKSSSIFADCREDVVCFGMLVDVPYKISNSFIQNQVSPYPLSLVLQSDSSTLICADTFVEYGILDPFASKILSVLLKDSSIALQLYVCKARSLPNTEPHDRATSKRRLKAIPQPTLHVIIYGAPHLFDPIGTFIAKCHYHLQQPSNCDRNVEYRNPHCLSPEKEQRIFTNDLESSVEQDNPHAYRPYLECNPIDAFTDTSQCSTLAETQTPSTLKTRLYKHQKQALTFMIRREEGWSMDGNQQDIWVRSVDAAGHTRYTNTVTRREQRHPPTPFRGGLLVDAPGLGKTLSMISLLALTKHMPSASDAANGRNRTALLVVPKTLIQTWKDELKRHLLNDAISYCEYYGPSRTKMFDQLQCYDLVITTFSVVRMDWKAHLSNPESSATLHAIQWYRIILDEAHIIREPTKSFAMSVCALQATRRWCVTGTPIQNRLLDLYSLFKFLKCAPFDDVRVFKAHISRDGRKLLDPSSVGKLKTLVNCLSLRRPKSTVNLPPRNDATRRLDFSPNERQHYETVKASATQCISEASEKTHRLAFLNALHRVNELRLICNHGIKDKNIAENPEIADTGDSVWTAEAAQTLFDEMETAGVALCSNIQCGQDLSSKMSSETDIQSMEEPRLGESSDLFCSTCFEGRPNQPCRFYTICNHLPRCSSAKKQENTAMTSSIFGKATEELPTKIEAVVKDLLDLAEGTKSVIFSSWTKTFDLLQPALINRSIRCVRLDGSLSTAGREKVLRAFRDNPGIAVLLATITCGGIGLNLTAASRAYIVEPQWNPMSESQALDRIHRLGQQHQVYTTRYLIKGTWEENVLKLQEHKQKIADVTLSEGSGISDLANRRLEYLKEIVESTTKA